MGSMLRRSAAATLVLATAAVVHAQEPAYRWAENIVIPQTGILPLGRHPNVHITRVKATFHFTFDPEHASVQHSYVPRLWASRKIGVLLESIRNLGADDPQAAAADGRMQGLVDEEACLFTEFALYELQGR